ncbi:YibE/F family protein [Amphibacillus sediminis]|uniref:YibE/F family protein n=1 Tax=Amphibacillus sediminis TaxID=360185 RepID=UPI00082F9ACC|nr:YibE/F family protein [Amphibacillus sediminis]
MNVLVILTLLLLVLMTAIGGKKGVRSFVALFVNFIVLLITVLIMTDPNANPIILTLLACIVISSNTLFFINSINIKTKIAFVATILTTVILLLFIQFITEQSMVQGFGDEEIEGLTIFSFYLGLDFVKVAASVVIMSTIGAVADIAISTSSPMFEFYRHNPSISRRDLFLAGMKIGRDLLASSANTLFFAFFGGYLALLVRFKDLSYSWGQMVNAKVFSAEMITIFCAGVGVAVIIPVTALLSTLYLTTKKE